MSDPQMATSTYSSAIGMEGHSTNRSLLFDGSNYQFLSNMMSIYMRSCDYEKWDVVIDGPYVPMKTKKGSEEMEPKQKSEWIDAEVKKVQINFKAINTLHCALNPMELKKKLTCKLVKEI